MVHSCAFKTMFLEVETDENFFFSSEVGTPENILKSRTMYGAF